MDSKVDSKPAWEASPPPSSFTVHPTTDSTYHTGRPSGSAWSAAYVNRGGFSPPPKPTPRVRTLYMANGGALGQKLEIYRRVDSLPFALSKDKL